MYIGKEGASVGGRGMISVSVCIDHLDHITLHSLDDLWCVCVCVCVWGGRGQVLEE